MASTLGTVDILINTADVYEEPPIIDRPDDVWDATIATNLAGTFKMIRAVMPIMKVQSWGALSI